MDSATHSSSETAHDSSRCSGVTVEPHRFKERVTFTIATILVLSPVVFAVHPQLVPAGDDVTTSVGRPKSSEPSEAGADGAEIHARVNHRSPWMVSLSPNGDWIAVSNASSGSVSLVRVKDRSLVAEYQVGMDPRTCCWMSDSVLAVAVSGEDCVCVLHLKDAQLLRMPRHVVGDEPAGICALSTTRVAVTLRGDDQLAILDVASGSVTKRLKTGSYPEHVERSPDGELLVTVCALDGDVLVHTLPDLKLINSRILMDDGFRPGNPIISPNSSSVRFACIINRHLPVDPQNIERGWTLDNRLAEFALPDAPNWKQRQIGLDIRGDAIGDPHWGAISPDGERIVISCGGSHELVLLRADGITWPPSNTEDFLPTMMEDDSDVYDRIPVGGRPLGLTFVGPQTVVVANYLRDSVQWVDLEARKVVGETQLGSPDELSLARRGESIFYDADRSLHSWFSCHTCHTDGHTAGQKWDTINDDSYDTFKLTPTLRGVTRTAPWTWHGWQTSLEAAMRKSLTDTLNTTDEVSDGDAEALVAFLATLDHPPNPNLSSHDRLTQEQVAGQTLFAGKAGCSQCHAGRELTSTETFDVGLGDSRQFYDGFNPPSLRSLHSRRRFLHDARGKSLLDVLTRHHDPERLGGDKLSPDELEKLIAYLLTL